ncbi:MAG: DUF2851 family protein [Verrucomicrobiae bacterium]|nr:DUF2851 family protein [Verrucomicrobiae bacterium]
MTALTYEQLRSRLTTCVLHEPEGGYAPVPVYERLAQAIWFDQRLRRDALLTADGRRVRVVSPGWWNLEAGPDFRRAVVAFGDDKPQLGDVEVHLRASDWHQHGHGNDPLYNDVLLHVVLWQDGGDRPALTASGRVLPRLVMSDQLEAPLEELYDAIDPESYPYNVDEHIGRCAERLQSLPPDTLDALLEDAGRDRLRAKARRLARWIQRQGVEQALYAAILEALGYKQNKEPMRRLAALLPVARLRELPAAQAQALLFGVAGFLPDRALARRDETARRYVRSLWSHWWKVRDEFAGRALSADAWRLSGLRPANFPWRRLAAMTQLLALHWELWPKILEAVERMAENKVVTHLAALFTDLEDPFWSRRYSFASKSQPRAELLIGAARARDIVINVVLPAVVAQGWLLDNPALIEKAENVFRAHPASGSNALVRFTAHRLFGRRPPAIRTAARQQGLLQIFHDFCLNDRSGCRQCQFPDLAREFVMQRSGRALD